MKMLLSTLLLVTATAAPAMAAPHCPPGELNVWGACVLPTPGPGYGIFDRGRAYDGSVGYDARHKLHCVNAPKGFYARGYYHHSCRELGITP